MRPLRPVPLHFGRPRAGRARPLPHWRALALALLGPWAGYAGQSGLEGVPLTRFYPYEEIGCPGGGAQLVHDPLGRIGLVQAGAFIVLNDATWRTLWRDQGSTLGVRKVTRDLDGTLYFAALGTWGRFRPDADGGLAPEVLAPAKVPAWVRGTVFHHILCTPDGVYFAGIHGVAYWNRSTREHHFFEITGVANLFPLHGAVVASAFDDGERLLDPAAPRAPELRLGAFEPETAIASAGNGRDELLIGTAARRLFILRRGELEPLDGAFDSRQMPGPMTSLIRLPEGRYAAALAGLGIILMESDGRIRSLLTGPEYEGVVSLASITPGVLWAATEKGLIKVLHGQPLTAFGRAEGLPVDWPQPAAWRGKTVIASGGHIYQGVPAAGLRPAHFRRMPAEPALGAWGMAAVGDSLLFANGSGVFMAQEDGTSARIAEGFHVARLVALNADTFLAIGAETIVAFSRDGEGWKECAPRIDGFGYPYMVHSGNDAAWVELGVNRAARIGLADGRLQARLLENFPWAAPAWINVSIVGKTAVLCGAGDEPLLLRDDETLQRDPSSGLEVLFAQSPHRIQRLCRDSRGTLWVSHVGGLFPARPRPDGTFDLELGAYGGINGPTPQAFALRDGAIWASTGNSMYRVMPPEQQAAAPAGLRPVLAALSDTRTNRPLPTDGGGASAALEFSYAQNSVQWDFFAGGYSSARPLAYEFALDGGVWLHAAVGSSVFLADLREGAHRLRVRLADDLGPVGAVAEFPFRVLPPWYRSWYAYAALPVLVGGLLWGLFRLSLYWTRQRHAALERQVAERTNELRTTMERLHRETETSATLAERNRLAAEIHDSLEQGFSGLAMQVETTAGLPGCPPGVQAGLAAARNMITFCRQEIRHAVHGMHSPILESIDLGSALREIAGRCSPVADFAQVRLEGTPRRLDPAAEHHLLRIAQEAIANAVKHASARHLGIVLTYGEDDVRLVVRDDGRGFDVERVLREPRGHLGVPSFRSRASKLRGTVDIESAPAAGTTVTVRIPYNVPLPS